MVIFTLSLLEAKIQELGMLKTYYFLKVPKYGMLTPKQKKKGKCNWKDTFSYYKVILNRKKSTRKAEQSLHMHEQK